MLNGSVYEEGWIAVTREGFGVSALCLFFLLFFAPVRTPVFSFPNLECGVEYSAVRALFGTVCGSRCC